MVPRKDFKAEPEVFDLCTMKYPAEDPTFSQKALGSHTVGVVNMLSRPKECLWFKKEGKRG